jgi:hypothetical protein
MVSPKVDRGPVREGAKASQRRHKGGRGKLARRAAERRKHERRKQERTNVRPQASKPAERDEALGSEGALTDPTMALVETTLRDATRMVCEVLGHLRRSADEAPAGEPSTERRAYRAAMTDALDDRAEDGGLCALLEDVAVTEAANTWSSQEHGPPLPSGPGQDG